MQKATKEVLQYRLNMLNRDKEMNSKLIKKVERQLRKLEK